MNKQFTEDYVSFEVAKLLKEKGFPEGYQHTNYFMDENGNQATCTICGAIGKNITTIPCLTHQMALKWLREVHNIVLDIAFEANKGWTFYVSHLIIETLSDGSTYIVGIQHSVWSDDVQQPYYKEYEEAVESALKYTLENLI